MADKIILSEAAKRARAEYQREWRRKNPGKQNEYQKRWRERHPERHAEYYAKYWEHKAEKAAAANNG